MLNQEIEVIKHLLADNRNIAFLDYTLFTETSYIIQTILDIQEQYGKISQEVLISYLINKEKVAHIHLLRNPIKYSFEEAQNMLIYANNQRAVEKLLSSGNKKLGHKEVLSLIENFHAEFRLPYTNQMEKHVKDTIEDIFNKYKNILPIGVPSFDKTIEFDVDRFITIGGVSGSGKTALAIFIAIKLLELHNHKINLLIMSLEMSEKRILKRLLSNKLNKQVKELYTFPKEVILETLENIKKTNLEILYDDVNISKFNIKLNSFLKESEKKNLIPILILDHIGEIAGLEESVAKQHVDKITYVAKQFCKKGGMAILLTQLRKDLLSKFNKDSYYKPDNSYIMNSQSVEARSDIIIHTWRPEQHNFERIVEQKSENNIIEIDAKNTIILVNGKNRDDNKQDIYLDCYIGTNTFSEITPSKIIKHQWEN